MSRIVDTETEIICWFEPSSYITDRRGCLFYILENYRNMIPDNVVFEIYDEMNLWDVDGLESALRKVEKYIGKTIITRPITDSDDSNDP
jgi:hypothetical protein